MRSNAQSVSARRAKAIALIKSGAVHSQSDLVVLLKKLDTKSRKQQQVAIWKRLALYVLAINKAKVPIKYAKVPMMPLFVARHFLQS